MGAILSGKNMAVDSTNATGIYAFHIEMDHYPPWMVGGNQSGAVIRDSGNLDWGGFFKANGHTPVLFPNDSFTFLCAPKQTGSVGVSGTAICLAIEIVVDQRNPRNPVPIVNQVWFAANGAIVPGTTAPTDTSTPQLFPGKGLCAYFGESQGRTKFQRLRIFSRGVVETVDCTSAGQFMRDGGEIDAEFEWIVNTDDSGDFPLPSAGEQNTRCYVTDSTYWDINWMEIVGYPKPWQADRRDRPTEPVDARFLAKFTAYAGTTKGYIKNPAGTTKWGA